MFNGESSGAGAEELGAGATLAPAGAALENGLVTATIPPVEVAAVAPEVVAPTQVPVMETTPPNPVDTDLGNYLDGQLVNTDTNPEELLSRLVNDESLVKDGQMEVDGDVLKGIPDEAIDENKEFDAKTAEADASTETPEEAPADLTDAGEIPADAEPESVRDTLTSRIDTLKAEKNPTPDQQKELSKAQVELAQRDRRDVLNASEPSTLQPDEQAELQELNSKFGEPNPVPPVETPTATIPEATQPAQELVNPGEFNEDAVREEIEDDPNRQNWTDDQKDAYVNGKRSEHEQKKAEYNDAQAEKQKAEEQNTENEKQKLDKETAAVENDLTSGKIDAQEASLRLDGINQRREGVIKNILEKHKLGKELTPFEKEVAEKGLELQRLMLEIQMAPKIMTAMEATLKRLKGEYSKATEFKISPTNADDPKTRENVALRRRLANQVSGQAAYMAKYADITSINVNDFISVNSKMMKLMGTRGMLRDLFVQIGTSIKRKAKVYETDIRARAIVQNA